MKLLLQAALRSSKHKMLAFITLIMLFFLTIANQTEMISLGMMANNGVEFFSMFGKPTHDYVTKKEVETTWQKIDKKNKGKITRRQASAYMVKHQKHDILNKVLYLLASKLNLQQNMFKMVMILLLVAFFKGIFLFFSRYASQLLSIKVTRDLRFQYFEHIQSLPLSFYQEHNIGTLSARAVGDAGQIASSLNSCLINYLQAPFIIATSLFSCFYLSWRLSLVIFLGLPLIILPVIFLTRRIKQVSRQMQRNQEHFTSVLIDFLSGIQTIKIFAMEKFSLRKYQTQNDKMAYLEGKNAMYSLLTRPVLHLITTFCLAFVVIIGLYTLRMSLAHLLVFCGFLHLFYEPVKKFAEENSNIQRGVVAAERMFEVLHLTPQIKDQENAYQLSSFNDSIEFRNISFRYKKDWVLKDLSFTVKKGEMVAIVGPTGAGKSTIVQLLPRLFDIQKGEILIDGRNIKTFTQKSLRDTIAFVPQKPFLFYDTAAENIAFGRDFQRSEIISAAKQAYAHEFIENLPFKYDTLLEETGKTLSGGQQQRLAIARALVKKAPILVMDEATSSLDAISENKIKTVLKNLAKKSTQIVIAHRFSTIEHADRIIYLESGIKIADGTREELLATCPEFKLMWESYHHRSKPRVKHENPALSKN